MAALSLTVDYRYRDSPGGMVNDQEFGSGPIDLNGTTFALTYSYGF